MCLPCIAIWRHMVGSVHEDAVSLLEEEGQKEGKLLRQLA